MRAISEQASSSIIDFVSATDEVCREACIYFSSRFGCDCSFFLLCEDGTRELSLRKVAGIGHENRSFPKIPLTKSRSKTEIQLCLEKNEVFYYDDLPSNHFLHEKPREREFLGANNGVREALLLPFSFNQQGIGVALLDFSPSQEEGKISSFSEALERGTLRHQWHKGAEIKSVVWEASEILYALREAQKRHALEHDGTGAILHCAEMLQSSISELRAIKEARGTIFSLDPSLNALEEKMASRLARANALAEGWSAFARSSMNYADLLRGGWENAIEAHPQQKCVLGISSAISSSPSSFSFHGNIAEMKDALSMLFGHFISRNESVNVSIALAANGLGGFDYMFHFCAQGTPVALPPESGAPHGEAICEAAILIQQLGGRLMSSPEGDYAWLRMPTRP